MDQICRTGIKLENQKSNWKFERNGGKELYPNLPSILPQASIEETWETGDIENANNPGK